MGPSLMPPSKAGGEDAAAPVMTFRPPGTTPISIGKTKPSRQVEESTLDEPIAASKTGGSKVPLIVAAVAALAAVGVVVGWLITN